MKDARTIHSMTGQPRYRRISDSARWDGFEFRPGDIVISTPPKCGTTWTQMICALLIFQTPTFAAPLDLISPWLDMLTRDRDEVVADLDAQTHRRFIKTHTPLTACRTTTASRTSASAAIRATSAARGTTTWRTWTSSRCSRRATRPSASTTWPS